MQLAQLATACHVGAATGALLFLAGCAVSQPGEPPAPAAAGQLGSPPVETVSAAQPAATAAPPSATQPSSVAGTDDPRDPGGRVGPCPAVKGNVKAIFARAAAIASGERAMAEAVRLRLDALYQHGCYRALEGAELRAEVMQVLPPPTTGEEQHLYVKAVSGDHVLVGDPEIGTPWVALYSWKSGKIRSQMVVHGTSIGGAGELEAMKTQLLPLDYAVFQPVGAPQPLLALVNTHPWMSSCWRTLRFRVLAPSGDPFRPKALLDHRGSGRWCESPTISSQGDQIHFDYFGWGGPWTMAAVWRSYRLTYQFQQGRLTERFGFAPGGDARQLLTQFVEDWLHQPWSLAEQATLPGMRDQLEAFHTQLSGPLRGHEDPIDGRDASIYSSELFPLSATRRRLVLYCEMESKKRCVQWPQAVDFIVERTGGVGGVWQVGDVKPR